MRKFEKHSIPKNSVWDRKSYDPIKWLYNLKEEQPEFLENYFFEPYFSIKNWLRYFFDFLRKMIKWIPIIWKDRDYDDYFIFEILKQKILQQRNYLVSNNRHTNIEKDNYWMTVCLNLIEMIQENHYELEYFDYEKSKIKFVETEELSKDEKDSIVEKYGNQKLYTLEREYEFDDTTEYIDKYPLDRDKMINHYKIRENLDLSDYATNQSNRNKLCLYMSNFRHRKAIRVLFLVMSEKIENWWD